MGVVGQIAKVAVAEKDCMMRMLCKVHNIRLIDLKHHIDFLAGGC